MMIPVITKTVFLEFMKNNRISGSVRPNLRQVCFLRSLQSWLSHLYRYVSAVAGGFYVAVHDFVAGDFELTHAPCID